jgi:ElaB/YqjD/DUF883 family membrane-anchored ribosome-binding protein
MTTETDKIEQDINRSRSALNDTIERLGGKLSPGQIVDEVLGVAQGQFGQFTANVGKQVRDNPLPLLLIGAGIGMFLLNQQRGQQHDAPRLAEDDWRAEHHFRKVEHVRANSPRLDGETDDAYARRLHDEHATALDIKQMAGETYDAFQARVIRTIEGLQRKAAHVRDFVASSVSKAGHFMHDQATHMGEMAGDAKDKVGDMASQAKHKAVDMYEENPLAAGAVGVAIGALLGALTPLSSLERKNLQGLADGAMKAGADMAERGAGAVEKAANSIVH